MECPFCSRETNTTVRLKPCTSGPRILSIDGGGTRGSIPAEHLLIIQGILGSDCPLQDYFDYAIGTSSGTYKIVW